MVRISGYFQSTSCPKARRNPIDLFFTRRFTCFNPRPARRQDETWSNSTCSRLYLFQSTSCPKARRNKMTTPSYYSILTAFQSTSCPKARRNSGLVTLIRVIVVSIHVLPEGKTKHTRMLSSIITRTFQSTSCPKARRNSISE